MSEPKPKWRLFAFHPMDYKAAEVWLNARAASGWQADRFALWGLLVRLVPTGRADLKYCVDITDRKNSDSAEYAKLCRDSGWTWQDTVRQMNIYASDPGADPPPIQTDGALEEERFLQVYFRRNRRELLLWLALLAAIVLAAVFCWPGALLYSLWNPRELVSNAILLLLFLSGLWQLAALLRYRRAVRVSVRSGGEVPARSRGQTRLGRAVSPLMLLLWVLLLVWPPLGGWTTRQDHNYGPDRRPLLREEPVVMAEDLGMDAGSIGGSYFDSGATPLLSYRHLVDPLGFLRTYHYRFAAQPLARWGAGVLLRDSRYPLEPVELGFDESWAWDRGDGFSVLLLRQGDTVVLLSGVADWTAPAVRAMLWERLDLTG